VPGLLFVKRILPIFVVSLAVTALIYWPGLGSPLLLDDDVNLGPIWDGLDGNGSWFAVVFGNESGPLGRPVSMATFLANAVTTGNSVLALKATNLLIHLAAGSALFVLITLLAKRDRNLHSYALTFACIIAVVWLMHPLFASTVLYLVQRMAMLSALFVIMALICYILGRNALEDRQSSIGTLYLFAGVPLFTFLAAFSKENGLLVPLFCLLLEAIYFTPSKSMPRPRLAQAFIALFVLIPGALVAGYLALNPDFFLAGYDNRPFTLTERVLTQTRVLFEYVGNLLLPVGQELTLYRENYALSSGFLTPPSTAFAIIAWLAIIILAIALRRRIPMFTAGIGIFIVGHAMESTFYPLHIYFEHRNYLAGAGILVAVGAVLQYGCVRLRASVDNPRVILIAATCGLVSALGFATFSRALAWSSPVYLLEQSVESYPDSRFARMELAALLLNRPIPDYEKALEQYRHLQGLHQPSTKMIGHLGEVAVSCFAKKQADPENLREAFVRVPESVQPDLLKVMRDVAESLRRNDCDGISASDYARRLGSLADNFESESATRDAWRIRYESARLFAFENANRKALEQAEAAWAGGHADLPVGMLAAAMHIRLEQFGSAKALLDEIEPRISEDDSTGQSLLKQYREAIREGGEASIFRTRPN
jgi:hypothetical protein